MGKILILVESPHKAETIKKMLGKNYDVIATVGHIMDLDPKGMSIDIKNNFEPIYVQNEDKKTVISEIKKVAKTADKIFFAADPDREGEMIAWSSAQILKIKDPKRISYTEITKDAITYALEHPRKIDMNLVDAQKTRRILDRIVGYEISPILMKIFSILHISAGRVQSVVARLIIDKENEINEFLKKDINSSFKFIGEFKFDKNILSSNLFHVGKNSIKNENINNDEDNVDDNDDENEKGNVKIETLKDAKELLEKFKKSKFSISKINDKILTRNPLPPFSTSSMQQASSNKLGLDVKRTMYAAQHLYEAGFITYLRTDSINLSVEALKNIGSFIVKKYGKEYHKETIYKSKGKNTQEAHEAIRPTDINQLEISGKNINNDELRLYNLIWKRTVASQMTPAKIKQIEIHIGIDNMKKYEFITKTDTIEFAGYLKVYNVDEINNENVMINKIPKVGTKLEMVKIVSKQTYKKPPSRYNDGSLVNKIKPENLNIGRPATTMSIITKIQERGYVVKKDVDGIEKEMTTLVLNNNKIEETKEKIMLGKENQKFVPTELGMMVNDFLVNYFPTLMNYQFTSDMEEKLDNIAEGETQWLSVMKTFYKDFHPIVEKVSGNLKELIKDKQRVIGKHPESGEEIIATIGKYGPYVKMKQGKKTIQAPIQKPLTIDTITIQDVLKLFEYPKNLGKYNEEDVLLQKGKFGYYLIVGKEKISVGDKNDISLDDAIKAIKEKEAKTLWKKTDGKTIYQVLNGPYGQYIKVTFSSKKSINVKLPKDTDLEKLKLETVKELVANWKPPKRRFTKKTKTE
jgi:DNA topoisomerase-1